MVREQIVLLAECFANAGRVFCIHPASISETAGEHLLITGRVFATWRAGTELT